MNKQFGILSLYLIIAPYLNAISNNDFPDMGHRIDSPLRQFIVDHNFKHSYQGLHIINFDGWYVATKQRAREIKSLQSQIEGNLYPKVFLEITKFLIYLSLSSI